MPRFFFECVPCSSACISVHLDRLLVSEVGAWAARLDGGRGGVLEPFTESIPNRVNDGVCQFSGPAEIPEALIDFSPIAVPHPTRSLREVSGRGSAGGPRRRSVIGVCGAMLLFLIGCRGAAHREVYQQKMAGEIRNLEDQLYEADYQNQVLVDELARLRSQVVIPEGRRARSLAAPEPTGPGGILGPGTRGRDGAAGRQPVSPPGDAASPTLPARPLLDQETESAETEADRSEDRELIPPVVPIPPGPDDLDFPDVDLGDPVPPAGREAVPELPPGQIPLPDSTRLMIPEAVPVPVGVAIDPSLSGGYRFDDPDERTGMHLAVSPVDADDRPISMEHFDLAGRMTVVLLDPQREPNEARLGRWEFDEAELREMIRPASDGGMHVYVAWQEKRPLGGKVIAHVKLSAGETELTAEAELSTSEASIAGWNPRGGFAPR